MFWNYVKYENPSSLAKDLIRVTQAKNEQFVNNVNDGLTDLRKAIIRKEIHINNIKRSGKYVALSNLSIYYTSKNIKNSCKTNKFKIWTPTWKEECCLADGSYSISDIQEYFENILEEHGEKKTDISSLRIYVN